jgi:alpha-tubulin suppressor-like RCC1 family protein
VVSGSKGAASVTCGAGHACLGNDNDKAGIWCWGHGGSGQLGNDDTHNQYTPVAVSGISAYPFSLAAGGFHTCAILSSPNVLCWGANDFGQLGDDQADASYTPVSAVGVP